MAVRYCSIPFDFLWYGSIRLFLNSIRYSPKRFANQYIMSIIFSTDICLFIKKVPTICVIRNGRQIKSSSTTLTKISCEPGQLGSRSYVAVVSACAFFFSRHNDTRLNDDCRCKFVRRSWNESLNRPIAYCCLCTHILHVSGWMCG